MKQQIRLLLTDDDYDNDDRQSLPNLPMDLGYHDSMTMIDSSLYVPGNDDPVAVFTCSHGWQLWGGDNRACYTSLRVTTK